MIDTSNGIENIMGMLINSISSAISAILSLKIGNPNSSPSTLVTIYSNRQITKRAMILGWAIPVGILTMILDGFTRSWHEYDIK